MSEKPLALQIIFRYFLSVSLWLYYWGIEKNQDNYIELKTKSKEEWQKVYKWNTKIF